MLDQIHRPLNVLVQGITGRHGQFHTHAMLDHGTHVIAGTSPNKAGQTVHGVPVYATVADAQAHHPIDASVIFVPPPNARAAMTEAILGGVKLIVCITEGVPVHDFLIVKQLADKRGVTIIGPNCPGILTDANKLGIIPANITRRGSVGIVSRSGTLTYEIAHRLSQAGIGQRCIIGIGGDPITGTSFVDVLRAYETDPDIDRIVLIGEIGGQSEQVAARLIARHVTKPVFAYVAGHHAPVGRALGHAGAIVGGQEETAGAKTAALGRVDNVYAASSLDQLINLMIST
jgi:succinyl-CoA synthetase alpha subunit